MAYSVIGYFSGITNIPDLSIAISKHRCRDRVPKMKVLTVAHSSSDFDLLCSRFGGGFVNFVLLNDEALEVCKAVGFPVAPIGRVDEADIEHPLSLLIS